MQHAQENIPHPIFGTRAIRSSALSLRISGLLNRNCYHFWTSTQITAKCCVDTGKEICRTASIEFFRILTR
jgi:hypothetical protein